MPGLLCAADAEPANAAAAIASTATPSSRIFLCMCGPPWNDVPETSALRCGPTVCLGGFPLQSPPMMRSEDLQRIALQFQEAVNLEADELEAWLRTEESQSVGFKPNGRGGAGGPASGRRIVEILRGRQPSEDDHRHMRKVVGYIHRHLAQRPGGDVTHARWRYSLLNWGQDPLRH